MSRIFDGIPVIYPGHYSTLRTSVYEFDPKGQHYVYRLEFKQDEYDVLRNHGPLPEFYVGLTNVSLPEKLYAHRSGQSNKAVQTRMKSGGEFGVTIINTGHCRKRMRTVEMEELFLLRRHRVRHSRLYKPWVIVLNNKNSPLGYNPDTPETAPGESYCPICKTVKPKDQFYADKSRGSGLSSKCRDCQIAWGMLTNRVKRGELTGVEAYRELKKAA